MKSDIVEIERWKTPQPQRDDTLCSAHGKKWCTRDLVADVYLKNDGSDRIHWTVCQHWLDNEPDVAKHETPDR
ncbi:hypothetical protein C1I97_06050 [Streptomyces sp. NTH33]|uniref:hypothetical protein n=1 Tax=Streptomyces sp. NTH33 TaxID=1735453 RepID=UPI000DA9EEEE|nr:hypothetical protein [Streptomyces sp. NTH33]PZH16773.1 hypothetical protein C1I97_06050 [Streptomyces sp. NTH33]